MEQMPEAILIRERNSRDIQFHTRDYTIQSSINENLIWFWSPLTNA